MVNIGGTFWMSEDEKWKARRINVDFVRWRLTFSEEERRLLEKNGAWV